MEKFLIRAKVEEWEHIKGRYVFRWAEGYLNLEGITEKGPVFSFSELEKGTCISHMHTRKNGERYVYKPVEHSHYLKDTISRWTGIYDKNGKKIWEGDIIKSHWIDDEDGYDLISIIKYDERASLYTTIGETSKGASLKMPLAGVKKSEVEVIGNRWDNPELVKED